MHVEPIARSADGQNGHLPNIDWEHETMVSTAGLQKFTGDPSPFESDHGIAPWRDPNMDGRRAR